MRMVVALLAMLAGALLIVPAQAKDTAARDWTTKVVLLPDGTFQVGNPDAPVTLTEYQSYTCPHCAAFAINERDKLFDTQVRAGKIKLHYIAATRDALDLTEAMALRCAGPTHYLALRQRFFTDQERLWQQSRPAVYIDADPADLTPEIVAGIAKTAGIDAMLQEAGVPAATIAKCHDKALLDNVRATSDKAWTEITGTPTFMIDKQVIDPHSAEEFTALLNAAVQ